MYRVIAVIGFLLLAGCASPTADVEKESPAEMQHGSGLAVPEWKVGDYWTYNDIFGGSFSLAVASMDGTSYELQADTLQYAAFDTRYDISFVGTTSVSHLSGSQGDAEVKFFDFPLHDGKNWTITIDGQDYMATAKSSDGQKFVINAVANEELYLSYTYSSATKYFDEITFFAPDGTIGYSAKLSSKGTAFAGETYRLKIRDVDTSSSSYFMTMIGQSVATINPDDLYLTVDVHMNCVEPRTLDFRMGSRNAPTDQLLGNSNDVTFSIECPSDSVVSIDMIPEPGEFAVQYVSTSAAVPEGNARMSIYAYSRA